MRRSLLPAAALVFAFMLAACGSDTTLRTAPPPDSATEEGGRGPRGGGGWPGLPELPSGPWSEIDPGEMPDVYFVTALVDASCCINCDGLYTGAREGDQDSDGFSGPNGDSAEAGFGIQCPVNYAIVDLFGQVVDEFSPTDLMPGAEFAHIDLLPSGPGRFLATAQGWGEAILPPPPQGDPPGPEDGPIQTTVWTPWVAWEVDAVLGTTTLVAYQDPLDYRVVIPGTGKRLDVGVYGVRAALDPADPDWLYLWGANYGCDQNPLPLRATHRTRAEVLDRFWSIEDVLGEEVSEEIAGLNLFPTEFATSIDEDGATHVLFGMGDQGCGGGVAPVNLLADFAPGEGGGWSRISSEPWSTGPVGWAPWNGGGALQIDSPWADPVWHLSTPEGEQSGPTPDPMWNVRAGPMLDPAGPTFVVLGSDPAGPPADSIIVLHAGEQVWSIDQLRFGLQPQDVQIMDIVVLPPWEDLE